MQIHNNVIQWLPQIGYKGLSVYVYVCHRSNPRTGSWCFEGLDNMAARLGMYRHGLQKQLVQLVDLGLLERVPAKHQPHRYRPTRPVPTPGRSVETALPQQDGNGGAQQDGTNRPQQAENVLPEVSQQDVFDGSTGRNQPTNSKQITQNTTCPANGREFVEHFARTFQTHYSRAYSPTWTKEGSHFKRLLQSIPPEDLVDRLNRFFEWWPKSWYCKDGFRFPTVADFARTVNQIPAPAPNGDGFQSGKTLQQLAAESAGGHA